MSTEFGYCKKHNITISDYCPKCELREVIDDLIYEAIGDKDAKDKKRT